MKRMGKLIALAVAAGLLCFCYLFDASRAASAEAQGNRSSRGSSAAKTASLFAHHCARCHGADGRGETSLGKTMNAPDFTDAEWQKEHASSRRLAESIASGRKGMPAFGKKLNREEIAALAAYVRRFKK